MHFVNASQIGPRKFIGTLGNQKNHLRSPIKARKPPRSPPNEGCCTKLVAWVHIVVHISLILLSLLMVLALILNGKSADGAESTEDSENLGNLGSYSYLWQLNSSDASIKAIIIFIAFCLVGSIVGLGMGIVLLTAEKERNIFKLKLWILYTIIVCGILIPCCIWQLSDGSLWSQQGKLLVIVALFTIEIFFLWIVAAFIKKIQDTPVPPNDTLITEV